MNMEPLYGAVRPRQRIWCAFEELSAGAQDGTYFLPGVQPGLGSEVLVVDRPGMLLFAGGDGTLYSWSEQT